VFDIAFQKFPTIPARISQGRGAIASSALIVIKGLQVALQPLETLKTNSTSATRDALRKRRNGKGIKPLKTNNAGKRRNEIGDKSLKTNNPAK
jgi:hypothetical protein